MNLSLDRQPSTKDCTFGELTGDDFTVKTLELPWVPSINGAGGQHGVSCIPPGTYDLLLHDSELHPKTFALSNPALGVIHYPNSKFPDARVAILIHVANFPSELKGCVGLGMQTGPCSLISSKVAYSLFKQHVPWINGHTLTIKDGS